MIFTTLGSGAIEGPIEGELVHAVFDDDPFIVGVMEWFEYPNNPTLISSNIFEFGDTNCASVAPWHQKLIKR